MTVVILSNSNQEACPVHISLSLSNAGVFYFRTPIFFIAAVMTIVSHVLNFNSFSAIEPEVKSNRLNLNLSDNSFILFGSH